RELDRTGRDAPVVARVGGKDAVTVDGQRQDKAVVVVGVVADQVHAPRRTEPAQSGGAAEPVPDGCGARFHVSPARAAPRPRTGRGRRRRTVPAWRGSPTRR